MGRSPCCESAHTNKGAWTKEEDQRLINHIRLHGEGCWRSLPHAAGLLRCGKSCRLRWINYLRPDLKRGNFTHEEDQLIIKLHSLLGNKWSLIAGRLPGRTDNEIKNYWNTHIKRKLISHGVDPQTHRPLNNCAAVAVSAAPSTRKTAALAPLIRSYAPSPLPGAAIAGVDGECRSGGAAGETEEVNLNLELSIGLAPFQSKTQRTSSSYVESNQRSPYGCIAAAPFTAAEAAAGQRSW